MEIEEIVKMIIFAIVLFSMIGFFVFFSDKGGGLIEAIKNFMRFGG